mgnify:CR=1 FL=1
MRICRVVVEDEPCFGVLEGVDDDGRALDDAMVALVSGTPFTQASADGRVLPLRDTRLLSPVVPSKILAVGRNYADHAKEMGNDVPKEPLIFLKPSTAVIGPGDPIRLPWQSEQVEHEAELAVVISRLCRNVTEETALDHVLGYTCANDVTARDLQRSDGQWSRAKGFDSFCPLGPWIETDVDLDDASITCSVNGTVRQRGVLGDMIFDVSRILVHISAVMTLLPGDVVLTGTPSGVGPLHSGDRVEVSIDGIGVLSNPVVDRG